MHTAHVKPRQALRTLKELSELAQNDSGDDQSSAYVELSAKQLYNQK